MSLIYDALRKSEEERRLGQVPTLLGHEPASWRHAREELERRRRTRWLLVPVVVLAIAGGWWIGLRDKVATTPPTAPRGAEPPRGESAPAPAETPPPATVDASTATPLVPAVEVPPAESATASPSLPRTPEDVAAKQGVDPATLRKFEQGEVFANSPEQLRPVQPTTETPVVPPEAELPAPLPDPTPEPAVAEVVALPDPAPPIAAAPAPAALPPPVATPVPAATPVPTPAPEPVAAMPEPAGVPSIYDLPFATRKSLPPLLLSMHVYTQDPARRFVLIDDERMVEGDRAGEVLLREIRSDGVVLEFQGTAFFVPRSGN